MGRRCLWPFYNRRTDRFGDGVRFLELVAEEVRGRAGDVPLTAKVPAETATPPFVAPDRITRDRAVALCARLAAGAFDALVPVHTVTVKTKQ